MTVSLNSSTCSKQRIVIMQFNLNENYAACLD